MLKLFGEAIADMNKGLQFGVILTAEVICYVSKKVTDFIIGK